jgi:hypothetical protein
MASEVRTQPYLLVGEELASSFCLFSTDKSNIAAQPAAAATVLNVKEEFDITP